MPSSGRKPAKSKLRRPGGHFQVYIIQVVFRNALEIGFLVGQYFLYGFNVPPVRVRSIPMHQGGGVLRVQTHGENRVPRLHVCGQWLLRGPQSGRAQSLGLEEDQSGRAGREGPQKEVHLRGSGTRICHGWVCPISAALNPVTPPMCNGCVTRTRRPRTAKIETVDESHRHVSSLQEPG